MLNESYKKRLQELAEINTKPTAQEFKNNIEFLNKFDFKIESTKNDEFNYFMENNKNEFSVCIKNDEGSWWLYGIIDGRLKAHAGKFIIGPAHDIDEFISMVNNRMGNNPILSPYMTNDKRGRTVNKEILYLIDFIRKNKQEIESIDLPILDEVKKLIKVIENFSGSDDKLVDELQDMYNSDHGLLNHLRKVEQLKFYKTMDQEYDIENSDLGNEEAKFTF